ncbi:hypothetical protein GCM10018966_104210 [Streptomyces yanii]
MIEEAERNRTADQALRQAIDARNELDAAAYQVERRLEELGDAAPQHERARAEMVIEEARTAVKEEAPVDRARAVGSELQQIYAALATHSAAAQTADQGATSAPGRPSGDDDVIDAEFDRG